MRVVLDEGVARDLVKELMKVGCVVEPFPRAWKGTKNGRLLALLEAEGVDVLLTNDRNLKWQQTLSGRRVAVVVLPTQKLSELQAYPRAISDALARATHGSVIEIPRTPAGRSS